jgi:hypothetical protein
MNLNRTTSTLTDEWNIHSIFSLRSVTSALFLLMIMGCSTVKTNDLPPEKLQNQIASGRLIQKGDHVTVNTDKGQRYEIEVTQVSEDSIWGEEAFLSNEEVIDENAEITNQTFEMRPVEIPIVEIVSIEKRELTPVGAAGAAAGAVGLTYFVFVLLPALLVGAIAGF